MRVLLACPGTELGGCELYFRTLADAVQASHTVELLSALPSGDVGDADVVHPWPTCESDLCAGHAEDVKTLLARGYDQVVLVLNSPEPVAGPCFDSVALLVAAAENGTPVSCIVQFVPSVLDVDAATASALATLAGLGALVCVSRVNRETLARAIGVEAGQIALIRNGVPSRNVRVAEVSAQRRSLRGRLGLESGVFVVVTQGRFVPSKRHEDLLDALERLQAERLDVHLVWPGAGSNEEFLRAEVSRRRLAGRIHFLGHLDDVTPVLLAADAAAFPSTEEGMSFSLLEAMAVGLPVVAARATSNPELIQHGENGLLAEPGDGMSYADALTDLLLDRKAVRFGAAAQDFQRKWCDISDALEAAVTFLTPGPLERGRRGAE